MKEREPFAIQYANISVRAAQLIEILIAIMIMDAMISYSSKGAITTKISTYIILCA